MKNSKSSMMSIYNDLCSKNCSDDSPTCGTISSGNSHSRSKSNSSQSSDPSNIKFSDPSRVKLINDVEENSIRVRMSSLGSSRCRQLSDINSSQGESSLPRASLKFAPGSVTSLRIKDRLRMSENDSDAVRINFSQSILSRD